MRIELNRLPEHRLGLCEFVLVKQNVADSRVPFGIAGLEAGDLHLVRPGAVTPRVRLGFSEVSHLAQNAAGAEVSRVALRIEIDHVFVDLQRTLAVIHLHQHICQRGHGHDVVFVDVENGSNHCQCLRIFVSSNRGLRFLEFIPVGDAIFRIGAWPCRRPGVISPDIAECSELSAVFRIEARLTVLRLGNRIAFLDGSKLCDERSCSARYFRCLQ